MHPGCSPCLSRVRISRLSRCFSCVFPSGSCSWYNMFVCYVVVVVFGLFGFCLFLCHCIWKANYRNHWDKRWKYVFPRQILLLLNCVLVVTTCLKTAWDKFKIHGYRLTQETSLTPSHLQVHWSRLALSLRAMGESPGENIVEPSLAICGVSWKF